MGTLEKFVEKTKFVHHIESRGVNRVAAKVAKEVGVLFENEHTEARAGEEKAEHHAGGAASGDAAAGFDDFGHKDGC